MVLNNMYFYAILLHIWGGQKPTSIRDHEHTKRSYMIFLKHDKGKKTKKIPISFTLFVF